MLNVYIQHRWQRCSRHLFRKLQTIHYGNWKEESSLRPSWIVSNVWPNDYNKLGEKGTKIFFTIIFSLSSPVARCPLPVARRPSPKPIALRCVDYRNATQSFPTFKCFYFLRFVCLGRRRWESGSCYTLWLISLHTMNSRDWKDCSNELNTLTHVCVRACGMCIL